MEEIFVDNYFKNCPGCNEKISFSRKTNLRYSLKNNSKCRNCLSKNCRKYFVNGSYFKNINTPDKAYILGFIYADGSIRKYDLRITVNKKDVDILEYIKKKLNSEHPIKTIREKYVNISFSNKELYFDLQKQNIIENKTYDSKIIPYNGKFFSHFIRGFFDGDGCITNNKKLISDSNVTFAGNYNFLNELNKFFTKSLKINSRLRQGTSKYMKMPECCWRLEIKGSVQLRKLYEFMYNNDCFSFERKKNKFKNIIECSNNTFKKFFKYNGVGINIKKLYEKGFKIADIAKELNILPASTFKYIKDNKFTRLKGD